MVFLTSQAATAIQHLVADQPGAGLRIVPRGMEGDQVKLGLEVASQPAETDEIVEEQGSRLFVDEQVSPLLDGKTLDARASEEKGVSFHIVS